MTAARQQRKPPFRFRALLGIALAAGILPPNPVLAATDSLFPSPTLPKARLFGLPEFELNVDGPRGDAPMKEMEARLKDTPKSTRHALPDMIR